jgi:hypothetical protein
MAKSLNDQEVECLIQRKGLNAPRLSPTDIDNAIKSIEYHVFNGILTVCCVTLVNGFTVTGESACASPANFDQEIGEGIAFTNAKDKIWMLEGYILRQKLFEKEQTRSK